MNEVGKDIQAQAIDSWQIIRNRFGLICLSFLLVFATAIASIPLAYVIAKACAGRLLG